MPTIEHVHPSEAEDFVSELRRHKRSFDEFDIVATREQPLTQQSHVISPVVGSITIKNKTTGAERIYRTGSGSTWIMQASDDIRTGVL